MRLSDVMCVWVWFSGVEGVERERADVRAARDAGPRRSISFQVPESLESSAKNIIWLGASSTLRTSKSVEKSTAHKQKIAPLEASWAGG